VGQPMGDGACAPNRAKAETDASGMSRPVHVGHPPYDGLKRFEHADGARTATAGEEQMATADETEDHWSDWGLNTDEIAALTALYEDVPQHLATSLWSWVREALCLSSGEFFADEVDTKLVRQCERVLRIPILWPGVGRTDISWAVKKSLEDRPIRDTWRVVNYLLGYGHGNGGTLKTFLLEAGSAYTVLAADKGRCYLAKRVPEGVQVAAGAAFQQPRGGKRLATAWAEAFGVEPDPTKAYAEAVKAVEDAAIPIICPNDRTATLGRVIGLVNSGTWKLPHLREDSNASTHDVLVGMMRTLWVGQHDRHGGPSEVGAPAVTQDEAESAVMLAVTLVGWFETAKVQQ
jgi:hypothetical protein